MYLIWRTKFVKICNFYLKCRLVCLIFNEIQRRMVSDYVNCGRPISGLICSVTIDLCPKYINTKANGMAEKAFGTYLYSSWNLNC
jgi:hypothetical protein